MPLLFIMNTLHGDYTIIEIIHPLSLISISAQVFIILIPSIVARSRYNRRVELGEIKASEENETPRKPSEPLGVLFGPGKKNDDKTDTGQ